ncbi:MAG: type VI secretion protein [Gammaproteobacteria bacterium HGW-Gammaproteobacteria-8]|nr:MAG: type VI secretion protein [Gammaproteobacteria bacterium HGW-Gammaproteobacteria-8]
MFAKTQMPAQSLAFPDVCLTPAPPSPSPVPIPYPNIAISSMAVPNVTNVLIVGMPAHNLGTTTQMTNGDNPGLATGVASGTVMRTQRNLTGAFTCLIKGMPATRLTSVSLQNSTNAPGATITPSQTKVLILAP